MINLLLMLPWLVVVGGASSFIVWGMNHRWRFSLRTLLIATTLIAVMLGLAVFLAKMYHLSGVLIEGIK